MGDSTNLYLPSAFCSLPLLCISTSFFFSSCLNLKRIILEYRPFHGFFQLLTWTSSGKSVDNTKKSALKLVKLPSLNVIC